MRGFLLCVASYILNIYMETLPLSKTNIDIVQEVAGKVLEKLPMSFAASDLGSGRRVFFPIPVNSPAVDVVDFIYVYVESKLLDDPQDPEIGFTEDDIINTSGVYIWKKVNNHAERDIFPVDFLLTNIIKDLSVQNRIIFRLNEMRMIAQIDDEFLELANMERSAKSATKKSIN
jgi:hypothetical protein